MIISILKLFVLLFNIKSEVKLENWIFTVSYLTINLSFHYLSNDLTVETDVLNFDLRGCYIRLGRFPLCPEWLDPACSRQVSGISGTIFFI